VAVLCQSKSCVQVYDTFDDVLLMANGRILYQGPRESVQPHFNSLGFELVGTKAEADFLQVRFFHRHMHGLHAGV
jgi:ABC-type multidrug transport system ATPase subunit